MPLNHYFWRKLPDSGAQQYAFIPEFMNPLYTLPGPGTPYKMQWAVTQPQQLYYNMAQRMDGVIGVVAGQVALTGLLDTRGISGAAG